MYWCLCAGGCSYLTQQGELGFQLLQAGSWATATAALGVVQALSCITEGLSMLFAIAVSGKRLRTLPGKKNKIVFQQRSKKSWRLSPWGHFTWDDKFVDSFILPNFVGPLRNPLSLWLWLREIRKKITLLTLGWLEPGWYICLCKLLWIYIYSSVK